LDQHPNILRKLNLLRQSLELQHLGELIGFVDQGEDVQTWHEILASIPTEKRNWLEAPWIISEFYFYRRVIECFDFFTTCYDPFKKQKMNGFLASLPTIEEIASVWAGVEPSIANQSDCLLFGILSSLWGNKKDLSLWPASLDSPPSSTLPSPPSLETALATLKHTFHRILDNDIDLVISRLITTLPPVGASIPSRNVGIVVDNAGFELLSDMFLGHVLLCTGLALSITFHTKKHPTFVSDATTEDCLETIFHLGRSPAPFASALAKSWHRHVEEQRFIFRDDFFWCQPTGFNHTPDHIKSATQKNVITFIKASRCH
jgi:damage-control phosphatase, subfamily III